MGRGGRRDDVAGVVRVPHAANDVGQFQGGGGATRSSAAKARYDEYDDDVWQHAHDDNVRRLGNRVTVIASVGLIDVDVQVRGGRHNDVAGAARGPHAARDLGQEEGARGSFGRCK